MSQEPGFFEAYSLKLACFWSKMDRWPGQLFKNPVFSGASFNNYENLVYNHAA
jgi:hypothetical protein